jgi:CrcB protein
MMTLLYVALGGAIGSVARYGASLAATRAFGVAYPLGTLGVNVAGGFLMGLTVAFFAVREPIDPTLKLFVTAGILGGFTTFSAFSLETMMLWERKPLLALTYALASVILSVAACFLGMKAIRWIS